LLYQKGVKLLNKNKMRKKAENQETVVTVESNKKVLFSQKKVKSTEKVTFKIEFENDEIKRITSYSKMTDKKLNDFINFLRLNNEESEKES